MTIEAIHRVVREYVFWVDGLQHTVKGRITEAVEARATRKYMWQISHHYQPSQTAKVYYPSVVSVDSLEEAERLLFVYAKSFTTLGVTPSGSY